MGKESNQCSNCHHRMVCQLRTDLAEKQSLVDEIDYINPIVLECKYRSDLKEEIERWVELNGEKLKEEIGSKKEKNGTVMTYQEIGEMKQETINKVSKNNVISLMTCFALAEHRLYGFGFTRINRTLQYIDELMDKINSGECTMDDFLKELEDETNIVIKCGD